MIGDPRIGIRMVASLRVTKSTHVSHHFAAFTGVSSSRQRRHPSLCLRELGE